MEALAIVGIGCRFPGGANGPEAYFDLLKDRVDAITDVPRDRWDLRRFYDPDPARPGKTYVRQAGFLREDPFLFDPTFFGISPREAEHLDPQQRLLLETTWEAFEDAGVQAERLAGSGTGVFVGGFTADQHLSMLSAANREILCGHSPTGNSMTVLAARLSYTFDLQGPAVTMDTACSSSLVAFHYACQSLWNDECELAIAGGANVMLEPDYFVAMSKGRFLSPDARCRSFDKDASGYARGEGAGVVLLKRLSNALRDRDRIYAVVRGTGVNQDGQTSGMPMPNPLAQARLISEVYRRAGIAPREIAFVEAHGTGTQAGDPAEAAALHRALRHGRAPGDVCWVGSVKSNIGHLEAAAGVAGLIKAALCLKHRAIPPNLHFRTPNPKIPFDEYCIRVVTEWTDLSDRSGPLLAGVNSFGFGGTNAHAVLQEPPRERVSNTEPSASDESRAGRAVPAGETPSASGRPIYVTLSAHEPQALTRVAGQMGEWLEAARPDLEDLAYTTTQRRSHLSHRLVVATDCAESLRETLHRVAAGEPDPAAVLGKALPASERRVVFVYTGMGPQWWGMGREIAQGEPVFREALDECDALFRRVAGWSVLEALGNDAASSRVRETRVAQPANVMIQVALTRLLESWGIRPDAVVGHSIGEVGSAWASGALTLAPAIEVSYHRSRLQQRASGGGMLAAGISQAEASRLLDELGLSGRVGVAAINSPESVTLAGERGPLHELAEALAAEGRFHRQLDVEVAYHSHHMDPIQDELLRSLTFLSPALPAIPLYSTVTGDRLEDESVDAAYWWRNVRQAVRFEQVTAALARDGFTIFVEIGPHAVLRHALGQTLAAAGVQGTLVGSLDRKKPERQALTECLATLHGAGVPVAWERLAPPGRLARLPRYPWTRERYRTETAASRRDRLGEPGHPLLNERVDAPDPAWRVELNARFFPFLEDHEVDGTVIVPGAFYVEAGLAAAQRVLGSERGPELGEGALVLRDIVFRRVLPFDFEGIQEVLIRFDPVRREYGVHSRRRSTESEAGGLPWIHHAGGRILWHGSSGPAPDLGLLRERCPDRLDLDHFYAALERAGLSYGPAFRVVREVRRGAGSVWARIERPRSFASPPASSSEEDERAYLLHPTLLDGCFQALLAGLVAGNREPAAPYVPVSIERLTLHAPVTKACWCAGDIVQDDDQAVAGNLRLFGDDGTLLAEVVGVRAQPVPKRAAESRASSLYYAFEWEASLLETSPLGANEADRSSTRWIVVSDDAAWAEPVLHALRAREIPAKLIAPGSAREGSPAQPVPADPQNAAALGHALSSLGECSASSVLYCPRPQQPGADSSPIARESVNQALQVVCLVQALVRTHSDTPLALGLVTCDAQVVVPDDTCAGVAFGPLEGLGQLIAQEHPNLECTVIDVRRDEWSEVARRVVDELLARSGDDDVALRGDRRFVKRLVRVDGPSIQQHARLVPSTHPVELRQLRPGSPDGLAWIDAERRSPGPGEIEVEVCGARLDHKDVLKVFGRLAPELMAGTHFGTRLGMDGAGRVVAVGEGVTAFTVGAPVVFLESGFRRYATIPAELAIPLPKDWRVEEVPALHSTLGAYYGLVEVARLQPGEALLVHDAGAGVGRAAIRIARWIGATVFATAGSDAERRALDEAGVPHVVDARSTGFAETIRSLTGGRGVDVVLGAAAGDTLNESLALLAPCGRYLDLGELGAVHDAALPMKPFARNLTFTSIDIDRLVRDRRSLVVGLLRRLSELFDKGAFEPAPATVFLAGDVKEAFDQLAAGRHLGEVVLKLEGEPVPALRAPSSFRFPDPRATYLITGGTGGFGLELARRLAKNGAGGLALVSRSGLSTPAARAAAREIESCGARLCVGALDVTDQDEVSRFVRSLTEQAMPPLRGVFHGAAVLDDAFLMDIDEARLARVMHPKVAGAVNLHEATIGMDLDFFVSLSSVSAVIGNLGQCNYVAANCFLDAFARYRRRMGLPATTLNLGALAEAGIVSRNERLAKMFEGAGVHGIPTETALRELERITKAGPAQIGLFDVDWAAWSRVFTLGRNSSRFKGLIPGDGEASGGAGAKGAEFVGLAGEPLRVAIRTALTKLVAGLLRLAPERIDLRTGVTDMGMDSLVVLELQLAIANRFGVELSSMELLKGPSIEQLTHTIARSFEDAPILAAAQ